MPAELENVVKNLWALRLQLLKDRTLVDSDGDTVFSSQARTEDDEIESKSKYGQAWKARAKAIPTILETLGLCYLGTVLLRLPLSLGDMHRYENQRLDDCLKFTMLIKSFYYLAGPLRRMFPISEQCVSYQKR